MNKTLYFLFLSIVLGIQAGAQCVPDNTLTGPDILFPPAGSVTHNVGGESIIVLPHAAVGVNYDETLQFRVPQDTSVSGLNATVDYIKLVSVLNLPGTLAPSCNPSNCRFDGGTHGCTRLQGMPGSNPDSLQLLVAVELKFSNGGNTITTNDTLRNIYLVVDGTIGLDKASTTQAFQARFYPNPASDIGFLSYTAAHNGDTEVKVTNVIGNTVFARTYKSGGVENKVKLDLSRLSPGIYLYTVKNGTDTRSGRFIISR